MDAKKLADILAAFAMIAEQSGELVKKPNVTDVEAEIGSDITAAERDEAWAVYTAPDDDESDDSVNGESDDVAIAGDDTTSTIEENEATVVTNVNIMPSVCINNVTIGKGQSLIVPKFDPDKPVLAMWIDGGFISIT